MVETAKGGQGSQVSHCVRHVAQSVVACALDCWVWRRRALDQRVVACELRCNAWRDADMLCCRCACRCCSYEHRVLLACKSGGDAWLDRNLLQKIFSRHGRVLDVFLPYGRKVLSVGLLHALCACREGGWMRTLGAVSICICTRTWCYQEIGRSESREVVG